MKSVSIVLLIVLFPFLSHAQFGTLSGAVKDASNSEPLVYVKVIVKSLNDSLITGVVTDFDGLYRINLHPGTYSVTFEEVVEYERFKVENVVVKSGQITTVNANLKRNEEMQLDEVVIVTSRVQHTNIASVQIVNQPNRTSSSGKVRQKKPIELYESNTETYQSLAENAFVSTKQKAYSTFSTDVDKAGYSNVRRFINGGNLPPKDAVRIEEMINYFPYNYPSENANDPLTISSVYTECPWNKIHGLLQVGIQAKTEDFSSAPPNNLVFLVDVSGSMQTPDKLDLLKAGLYELTTQLRPQDQVAIVAYAGASGLVLPTTAGSNKTAIRDVLESLTAGGSTAGSQGIIQAYEVARLSFIEGGNNRIILATDGDFNVGTTNDDELITLIEKQRESGVLLSVLGFGTGNLQDAKMEKLADHGNGSYTYIDDITEARKALVEEIGGTLNLVAKDVKLQVLFNPEHVKGFRLIGYENRMLDDADFENDAKDAGDMGSGQSVTALYEIIPANSDETIADLPTGAAGSRSPKKADRTLNASEVACVDIRYKSPGGNVSKLLRSNINAKMQPITQCSPDVQFAVAVAEFGLLLRQSDFRAQASVDQVLELAKAGLVNDKSNYRAAFVELVNKAEGLGLK